MLLVCEFQMDPLSRRVHPTYPVNEYVHLIKPPNMVPIGGYVEFEAPTHIQSTKLVTKWRYALGLPSDVDGRVPDLLDFP